MPCGGGSTGTPTLTRKTTHRFPTCGLVTCCLSSHAALVMAAFTDFLDDLGHEWLEICGATARDHSIVDDYWFILPVGARIDHIGTYCLVGRCVGALDHTGLDQQPRAMADGGQYLAGFVEVPDELHGLVIDPQEVRIDLAAGDDERVVGLGVDVLEIFVDRDGLAPILVIPAPDFIGALPVLGRRDLDCGPSLPQLVPRSRQLNLLDAVGGDDEDFGILDVHGASPSLPTFHSFNVSVSVELLGHQGAGGRFSAQAQRTSSLTLRYESRAPAPMVRGNGF